VAGTVTRFKLVWLFPLGIPKGKGFQTLSSISWGFEGKDPTGNRLHSAWGNSESDEELRNVFSDVLPTTAALCLIWFLKPIKKLFIMYFSEIYYIFFLDSFCHFLYLFEKWEIFMPYTVPSVTFSWDIILVLDRVTGGCILVCYISRWDLGVWGGRYVGSCDSTVGVSVIGETAYGVIGVWSRGIWRSILKSSWLASKSGWDPNLVSSSSSSSEWRLGLLRSFFSLSFCLRFPCFRILSRFKPVYMYSLFLIILVHYFII